MSRSRPSQSIPNPATRRFKWHGATGVLRYWDKAQEKEISVEAPFRFILLDERSTVTGFHEASNSAIYANEVKSTTQSPLTVKSKAGVLAEGFYKDIRAEVGEVGGNFTANLYVAFQGKDGLEIGLIQFRGAGLKEWMEFRKTSRNKVYEKAITLTGAVKGRKGSVTFYSPTFELSDSSANDDGIAKDLDEQLQDYFDAMSKRGARPSSEAYAEQADDLDDVPF